MGGVSVSSASPAWQQKEGRTFAGAVVLHLALGRLRKGGSRPQSSPHQFLLADLTLEKVLFLLISFLTETLSLRMFLANDNLGVPSARDRLKAFHSQPMA